MNTNKMDTNKMNTNKMDTNNILYIKGLDGWKFQDI